MSDLLRSLPSISPSRPPPRPSPNPLLPARGPDFDPEAYASSSSSSASTADSIDTLRPQDSDSSAPVVAWSSFFAQELYFRVESASSAALYHVYLTPPADPKKGPLFICHHGAGSSGMSFALFARAVLKLHPRAGVLSLEAREHGSVVTDAAGQDLLDFSAEALVADALAMIEGVRVRMGWSVLPPSVFVGHSLGGTVATRIAADGTLGAQLVGFQVLDVVEGSAMEALSHMRTYLASRPERFETVDEAVSWHVRTRTLKNAESARATVPALLRAAEGGGLVWKTDLTRTQRWWEGWFKGLSEMFLRGKAAKGLVLAGTDRLDKELMVGQMQGKFQMTVLPESGHFIQEDVPERMAQLSVDFFKRNDRSAMVLPPKVSDLIAQGKKV